MKDREQESDVLRDLDMMEDLDMETASDVDVAEELDFGEAARIRRMAEAHPDGDEWGWDNG